MVYHDRRIHYTKVWCKDKLTVHSTLDLYSKCKGHLICLLFIILFLSELLWFRSIPTPHKRWCLSTRSCRFKILLFGRRRVVHICDLRPLHYHHISHKYREFRRILDVCTNVAFNMNYLAINNLFKLTTKHNTYKTNKTCL